MVMANSCLASTALPLKRQDHVLSKTYRRVKNTGRERGQSSNLESAFSLMMVMVRPSM